MADPKYADGAKTIVDTYQGERVLILSDTNHYRAAETYGFSSAVIQQAQSKGITMAGYEIITPGQQPIMDAYMRKEISRSEFLQMYAESPGSGQLGDVDNRRKLYSEIADQMDKGIKVVGLGSYAGIVTDVETDKHAAHAETLYAQAYVDAVKFNREHATDIDKDPKGFLNKYISHLEKNGELSAGQKSALADIRETMSDPKNAAEMSDPKFVKSLIRDATIAGHPAFDERQEAMAKIKPPDNGGNLVSVRMQVDVGIADRIAKTLAENPGQNMAVVYGQVHTIHDKDIDGELRKKGISTMIVDANPGKWNCETDLKMDATSCGALDDAVRRMERDAQRSGDPNRYVMPDAVEKPNEIIKRPESKPPAAPAL